MSRFFVGVDLGQVRDPTAIAVVEATDVLRLRHLERVALKTKYMQVVARVRRISRCKALDGKCQVVSDATGVGRPVAEMLQAANLGGKLVPVVVTAGERESRQGEYRGVPKRDLIAGLSQMLRNKEVLLASDLRDRQALQQELAIMTLRLPREREQYAAWRYGEHDDTVFAVALACWGARRDLLKRQRRSSRKPRTARRGCA